MDKELHRALTEGYREIRALQEGIIGKALSIGALVAGTLFSGCAANKAAPRPVTLPADAPLTQESVSRLAEEIAGSIETEMAYADEVGDTESFKAAEDIYRKIKAKDRPLADMFVRKLAQTTGRTFLDADVTGTRYDNRERDTRIQGPTYDEETGTYAY